jgi:MFS family permease
MNVSLITSGFTLLGVISTSLVGFIADRLSRKNVRWMLYVPALLQLICVPFYPFLLLSNDLTFVILIAIVPMLMGGGAYTGPIFAALQNVAPLRMRAMATGVLLFMSGLFGSIIGPQMVGSLSHALSGTFGADSLRYAMLIVFVPCLAVGGALFWHAAKTLEEDMALAREQG